MNDNSKNQSQLNIIEELGRIVETLGWAIAIPDKNTVDHLIIGKADRVKKVTDDLSQDYDILVKEPAQ